MILVWLSPGLPADRAELSGVLPAGFGVLDAAATSSTEGSMAEGSMAEGDAAGPTVTYGADDIHALPAGSLCVATVFEPELLAQLARRPAGVKLLVVGPQEALVVPPLPPGGTPPDHLAAAASVADVAKAIQDTAEPAASSFRPTAPLPLSPFGPPAQRESRRPGWLSNRVAGAAAVLLGLAIGGVVIAATEGSGTAGTNRTAFGAPGFGSSNGNSLPGVGGQAQNPLNGSGNQAPDSGSLGSGQLPRGDGDRPGDGRFGAGREQLLACLQQQGITITRDQLRQGLTDPKLRSAFEKCLQSLGAAGFPRQLPARP